MTIDYHATFPEFAVWVFLAIWIAFVLVIAVSLRNDR